MPGTRISTSITIDGKRVEINVPYNSSAWQKANSVFCPLGPAPTKAFLVVSKQTLSELDKEAAHTISWVQKSSNIDSGAITETISLSFSGLYFISSERVLQGGVNDDQALHLLELADQRYLAAKRSDSGQLVSNLRSYANSSDYLTGTTTYGTWGTLVQALWEACSLGNFPGLPLGLPIDGSPQSYWAIGLNAYRCLNVLLDQLDCAINHNPLTNVYTIVQLGEAQTIPSGTSTLKWDGEPDTSNTSNLAANLKVYFHNYLKSYGQERDSELENNWAYNAHSDSITVATGVSGSSGTLAVWDDLPRIYNEIGNLTNEAGLTTRANNRKSRYVTRTSITYRHKIYAGLNSNYLPGGQIKACLWRNWGDGNRNVLGGTSTEYVAGIEYLHDFKAGTDHHGPTWFDKLNDTPEWSSFSSSNLGKHSYPNYPRLSNVVQINHSGFGSGESVAPTSTYGLHRGRVRRWVNNELATLDPCWILFIDDYDTKFGQWAAKQGELYGPARLSGITTDTDEGGSSTLPVYLCYKGATPSSRAIIYFKLTATLSIGGEASAVILEQSTLGVFSDGDPITVTSGYDENSRGLWSGLIDYKGIAFLREDGKYEVIYMQRNALIIEFTAYANRETAATTFQATISSGYQHGDKLPTTNPITIHDTQLLFPRVVTGAKGKAVYNDLLDRYDCLIVDQVALLGKAKVNNTAGMLGEVENVVITQFVALTQAPFGKAPNPLPTQAHNRFGLRGKDQDDILVVWDENNAGWLISQVMLREKSYVGKASAAIAKGETKPVQIYVGGVPTGTFLNAKALGAAITANKWVSMWTDPVDSTVYVAPWECG